MPRYILYPLSVLYLCFCALGLYFLFTIYITPFKAKPTPKQDPYADISKEGQSYGDGVYEKEAEARIEGLERDLTKIRNHGLKKHSVTETISLGQDGIVLDSKTTGTQTLIAHLDQLAETEYVMVEVQVGEDAPTKDLNALTQTLSDHGFDYILDF